MPRKHTTSHSGVTLLESIIVLGIVALILSFSFPQIRYLRQKNETRHILYDLKQAIQVAKLQSILLGQNVLLKPIPPYTDWQHGIVLVIDSPHLLETHPIHIWQWIAKYTQVIWKGFASQEILSFVPHFNHSGTNGTFILQNSFEKYVLKVNRLGKMVQDPM